MTNHIKAVSTGLDQHSEQNVAGLEIPAEEKDKVIAVMVEGFAQRDDVITELTATIARRDDAVAFLNSAICARDTSLADVEEANLNKQMEIEQLQQEVKRLSGCDVQLDAANRELKILKAPLENIQSGFGQYLSAPARWPGLVLNAVFKGLKFLFMPLFLLLMRAALANGAVRNWGNLVLRKTPKLAVRLLNLAVDRGFIDNQTVYSPTSEPSISDDMTELEKEQAILAVQLARMTLSAQAVFLAAKNELTQSQPKEKV